MLSTTVEPSISLMVALGRSALVRVSFQIFSTLTAVVSPFRVFFTGKWMVASSTSSACPTVAS